MRGTIGMYFSGDTVENPQYHADLFITTVKKMHVSDEQSIIHGRILTLDMINRRMNNIFKISDLINPLRFRIVGNDITIYCMKIGNRIYPSMNRTFFFFFFRNYSIRKIYLFKFKNFNHKREIYDLKAFPHFKYIFIHLIVYLFILMIYSQYI
uniref:Uncharacterized protein n=1 Tax=Onchocerca volvulus TaxID=6282 RepID=A0A8R1XL05_ONCVO